MNVDKIRNLTDIELESSAAGAVGPALQDEVSAQDGTDRKPEENSRVEERHCAGKTVMRQKEMAAATELGVRSAPVSAALPHQTKKAAARRQAATEKK